MTTNSDPWTFRFSYHSSAKPRLLVHAFPNDPPESSTHKLAAIAYDDGSMEVIGEIADLIPSSDSLIQGNTTGYLSFGYHLGKWKPSIVFGASDSNAKQDHRAQTSEAVTFKFNLIPKEFHQKSYSLGLRYNLNPRIAFKVMLPI